MNEPEMVDAMNASLRALGITDTVQAVGQFQPRGHNGAMFAGGLVGEGLGAVFGGLGDLVGGVGGVLAGSGIHDRSSGLPGNMLVGVSPTHVYGFAATGRLSVRGLVFGVARSALTATVHQRVNVRVLELTDDGTGDTIELEGNRMPVTHTKDVISILQQ
jgi:hypothetical protein